MSLRSKIVSQFKEPRGVPGQLAGLSMTLRPSNRQRIRWTLDLLALRKGDRVLEVGFGPGLGLQWAARKVKSGTLWGIDHSETMTEMAKRRNRRAVSRGRMILRAGTIDDLEREATGLDKIYGCNVIQFLDDQTASLKMLGERLKPGGIIAMTFMPRNKGASEADAKAMAGKVEAAMHEAGLVGIETKWLPVEPVPAICTLGTRQA